MKAVTVKLNPLGKELRTRAGTPLIDLLHELGIEFPCGGKGTCGKCRIRILEGVIQPSQAHQDRLNELGLGDEWKLACMSICSTDLVLEVGQYETIIQADETPFEFKPGKGMGIAFDLGTTTLVGQMLDLSTGEILAVETGLNPQKKYGSDLISRLESALSGKKGEMVQMIRRKIGQMIDTMAERRQGSITSILLVGNTVMQHLFCDFDIESLSYYPFQTPHLGAKRFEAEELGWGVSAEEICFYPSIGSFVGSDILAGIMATGMFQRKEYTALIDLGTNGEIVLGSSAGIVCSSTAAGPAFEGARISMGMLATSGAISSVTPTKEGWNVQVIGKIEPRGICGSGLIDAVAVLMEKNMIGEFGEILSGDQFIQLEGPVRLTQKDIQEFQLAKAAIATGLELLLRKLGLDMEDIQNLYISGGFGSYLNPENVRNTGMLNFAPEQIHQLGNSALMGAKMFLFADPQVSDSILSITQHVNLESEPDFQDLFVQHLSFPVLKRD